MKIYITKDLYENLSFNNTPSSFFWSVKKYNDKYFFFLNNHFSLNELDWLNKNIKDIYITDKFKSKIKKDISLIKKSLSINKYIMEKDIDKITEIEMKFNIFFDKYKLDELLKNNKKELNKLYKI